MISDEVNELLKSYEKEFGYSIKLVYSTSTKQFYVANSLEIKTDDGCLKGIIERRDNPEEAVKAFDNAVTTAKYFNTLLIH